MRHAPKPGSITAVLNDWHADAVDGPEAAETFAKTARLLHELASAGYVIAPAKLVHAAYEVSLAVTCRDADSVYTLR